MAEGPDKATDTGAAAAREVVAGAERILLVDDNPTNLTVLFQTLDGQGYQLLVAQDGEEALRVAAEAHPDLILLDILMPRLNGYDTCTRLKADPVTAETPVIFMSALDEIEEKVKGFEVGAVDYITKPFQTREVLCRVETHLELQRLRRQLRARVAELEAALGEVKRLSGLLPICAYCKRIREGDDYWQQVESYISDRTEAQFSHGVCPDCFEKHVQPEIDAL
ncbi:MAG: response regulator [Planctomycetota bacterium]